MFEERIAAEIAFVSVTTSVSVVSWNSGVVMLFAARVPGNLIVGREEVEDGRRVERRLAEIGVARADVEFAFLEPHVAGARERWRHQRIDVQAEVVLDCEGGIRAPRS